MNPFLTFLSAAAAAFFTENLTLSRAFGVSELIALARQRCHLAGVCLCVTALGTAAGFFSWLLLRHIPLAPLQPLLCLVILALLYVVAALAIQRLPLGDDREKSQFLRLVRPVAFGSGLAGILLLCAQKGPSLSSSLGWGLGGGLGFCLALFYALQASRHFAENQVPKPFQGLPVTLLYLGLLSLAFYGLLGSGLSLS